MCECVCGCVSEYLCVSVCVWGCMCVKSVYVCVCVYKECICMYIRSENVCVRAMCMSASTSVYYLVEHYLNLRLCIFNCI